MHPLPNIIVKSSFDDKYEIILLSVSSYIRKYLLKCLAAILGKITSKKFSIFGITFGSLEKKTVYLLKCLAPILGKITSKKFSIFGITFGSLKKKNRVCSRLHIRVSQIYPIERTKFARCKFKFQEQNTFVSL